MTDHVVSVVLPDGTVAATYPIEGRHEAIRFALELTQRTYLGGTTWGRGNHIVIKYCSGETILEIKLGAP